MLKVSCALSEREARARLRAIVFPKGRVRCPHCGRLDVRAIEARYWCRKCRKKFSLLSHTWLKHLRLPVTTLFLLLDSWMQGFAVEEIQRLTGVSRPTIYRANRLFRIHVVKSVAFKPQKDVQVDEAYFGSFKKQANWYHGKRTYRVVAKTCVAGISCPSSGTLAMRVIEGKPGIPIKAFIRENVPARLIVYSDGSNIYRGLTDTHFLVSRTHDQGFHNAYYIESCWSWAKRKLFRQYHHFTRKYASEYIAELEWRFNTRNEAKDPLFSLRNCFPVFH